MSHPAHTPFSLRCGHEAPPSILAFGLQGRMRRLPYVTATCVLGTVFMLLYVQAVRRPGTATFVLFGMGAVLGIVYGLRWSALRLHDMNRSGWWALLTLLPTAGIVASLVLAAVPGTPGENDHGRRSREGHPVPAVLAVIVAAACLALGWRDLSSSWPVRFDQRAGELATAELDDARAASVFRSAEAIKGFREGYAHAPGHRAFAHSRGGAWGWNSGADSIQAAIDAAIARCERHRRADASRCKVVHVNDQWVARGWESVEHLRTD